VILLGIFKGDFGISDDWKFGIPSLEADQVPKLIKNYCS
jgi:hypothetical protein